MRCKISSLRAAAIFCLVWTVALCPVFGGDLKTLFGHVPAVVSRLQAVGNLPATNELRLAIGLPLRDPAGLTNFLSDIYNPASPNFHHYLTPEEFTARFGPTESDYAAVKIFAQASGFEITGTHGNRLLLDVRANVADIQRAFHLNLRQFKHPSEARDFFAPDAEPTVDANLPVADVSGLSDYERPHPKLVKKNSVASKVVAKSLGSAPTGDFLGDDFRAAYVPDTTLTGAGQSVGLLEFDGFDTNDITAYAQLAGGGRTNIAVQPVLIDHFDGNPSTSAGNEEVSLDIEMAMAMAPGLARIMVFSASQNVSQNDILNAMAASNTVKNLSCSWGWGGGPSTTTDNIFKEMAAQGQSFFSATGDSDAFTTGANSANGVDNLFLQNAPASSPYITQVGGTTLVTTGPGGAWQSESVWNWGGGTGSSGGISSYYSIPTWQANVNMAINQGSTTKRNTPDVAMNSDNVYIIAGGGVGSGGIGGTSCAAPLWAGLAALANQQSAANNEPAIGFINPAIYALGASAEYTNDFHDITVGDNTWSSSPSQFFAVSGYDLCTGWGTPAGQGLLDALAGRASVSTAGLLQIFSDPQLTAVGAAGGPFSPSNSVITLTNAGNAPLTWAWQNPKVASWLSISPTNGLLNPQAATNLAVNFTAAVNSLAVGNYSARLAFTNQTLPAVQYVTIQLQVLPVLSVQPTNGFTAVGPVGGPFIPAAQDFTVVNLGGTSAVWKVVESSSWLAVSPTSGTVAAADQTNFTVSLTAKANTFRAGIYKTTVTVRNAKNKTIQSLPFTLSIGQNIVANGGFETGNFSGWTVDASSTLVTNRGGFVHSGHHGVALGQSSALGYLAQTLPTIAGQTYLVSLWLDNPKNSIGATPNEFQVQWEGATIFDVTNLPFLNWTNLQFTVTAEDSGSLLQFGFQDNPYFLGLDDVSVKPVTAPHLNTIVQSPAAFNFTFDTTPGALYQVQYKTNLLQPDWINLGGQILSETNSLKFTDTDIANFPQKFYRLMLVP
jgi:hypothetical protein